MADPCNTCLGRHLQLEGGFFRLLILTASLAFCLDYAFGLRAFALKEGTILPFIWPQPLGSPSPFLTGMMPLLLPFPFPFGLPLPMLLPLVCARHVYILGTSVEPLVVLLLVAVLILLHACQFLSLLWASQSCLATD